MTALLAFRFIELLRGELARIGPWWWMGWNAFLALIPVLLAVAFLKRAEQENSPGRTVLFFGHVALILLFLPNAPYVVTDLIHFLEAVRFTERGLWDLLAAQLPLYSAFVLFGLICYSFVTDRMLFAIGTRFGRRAYFAAMLLIPLLNAIGVYLGRVARFNSWDILREPLDIARSGRGIVQDAKAVIVIIAMAVLLIIAHQIYRTFHDGLRVRLAASQARRRRRSAAAARTEAPGRRAVPGFEEAG